MPPRAYQFVLDAKVEGYGGVSWRWGAIEIGETKQLGDIELVPAGTVVGRVVDGDGDTLTEYWRVTAETPRQRRDDGRDTTTVRGWVNPRTGEFRIDDVPAGRVLVSGRSVSGVDTNEIPVEVVAGVETMVELVYDGPDLDRRITVVPFSRPFYTFEPAPDWIDLIAADGTVRSAYHVKRWSQTNAFDDVPDGVYRVEIDDPLFELWSRDDVRPGERVEARLRGGASVELEVVDGETGRPVPRYGLRVVFPGAPGTNEFELLPDGSLPPTGGVFEGLLCTDQRLVVRPMGRAPQPVFVGGLTRGERRTVRVELGRGAPLVGRVLDAAGVPVAGATVERTLGAIPGLPRHMSVWGPSGPLPNLEEAYDTDGDGRFVVAGAAAGEQTFRVRLGQWLVVDRTVELPLEGGEELEVRAPPAGWLEGHLLLPEGASAEGYSLVFHGEGVQEAEDFEPGDSREGSSMEANGTFRYGPLPAGDLEVGLAFVFPTGNDSCSGATLRLGAATIEPSGTTRRVWNMRTRFPGSARVGLRVDGDRFAEIHLSFEPKFTALMGLGMGGPDGSSGSFPKPDAAGRRVKDKLAPGWWGVRMIASTNAWQWKSPDLVRIEAGRATDVELTLDLVLRRVRFIDEESGDPLAGTDVVAWTGVRDWLSSSTRATTDDEYGTLEFRLPPGEVRFCRAESSRPRRGYDEKEREADNSVAVEWRAADDELIVRLPRRAE